MRPGAKSSIYRHEVRRAALEALLEAVGVIAAGGERPDAPPVAYSETGHARPLMRQEVRVIDWSVDGSDAVVRKVRAADGHPGVLDEIGGVPFHLFGAHHERALRGAPGEIVARRTGAICRATVDGAVWITHLRQADSGDEGEAHIKLPATRALELAGVSVDAPEVAAAARASLPAGHTYREISYEERGEVGYLRFDFYNGAMSTDQCLRLREAYRRGSVAPADEGDRADGRDRLLLQRHPPQRDRGRRGPGGGVVAAT